MQEAGVQLLPEHLDAAGESRGADRARRRRSAFVGTYGGFSYLAPFLGVATTAYYSNAAGFSPRHLLMAQSALSHHGRAGLLHVQQAHAGHDQRPTTQRLTTDTRNA